MIWSPTAGVIRIELISVAITGDDRMIRSRRNLEIHEAQQAYTMEMTTTQVPDGAIHLVANAPVCVGGTRPPPLQTNARRRHRTGSAYRHICATWPNEAAGAGSESGRLTTASSEGLNEVSELDWQRG